MEQERAGDSGQWAGHRRATCTAAWESEFVDQAQEPMRGKDLAGQGQAALHPTSPDPPALPYRHPPCAGGGPLAAATWRSLTFSPIWPLSFQISAPTSGLPWG